MTRVLGINVIGGEEWMGGLLYVRNLAVCLSRLPHEERPKVVLLGGISGNPVIKEMLALPGVRLGCTGYWLDRPEWSRRLAYGRRLVERKLFGRHRDPWFRGIDAIYPVLAPMGLGAREIYWVPDFQPAHLPELFSAEEIAERDRHISRMAQTDGIIVFSSQMAADDFARLYPGARARSRIWSFCSIIDLPADPIAPCATRALPERYLYLANQFWAHKNHIQVFEALKILKDRGIHIPVVCTGKLSDYRNPEHVNYLQGYLEDNGIRDRVHLLGMVPREEQISLFRYSAAVIQPSRFEGWSTVIEDTRAIGRPLFASDFPVHREQMPNARFFPLGDAEALADLLQEAWPSLAFGPDIEAEDRAQDEAVNRQMESARAFLAIMAEATQA